MQFYDKKFSYPVNSPRGLSVNESNPGMVDSSDDGKRTENAN